MAKSKTRKTLTTITVTGSFIGFHSWPQAPAVVSYLRQTHRHVFGVEVEVAVTHSDRQVEFHLLQQDLRYVLRDTALAMEEHSCSSVSCEYLAQSLLSLLSDRYGYKVVTVKVDEDKENWATVHAL